ncbi:MAG: signal peptidase I [Hypericibacter sp.]
MGALGKIAMDDPILLQGPPVLGAIVAILAAIDAGFLARRIGTVRLRAYNKWYFYGLILVLVLSAVGIWETHTYRSFSVPSAGMVPALLPGDRFFVLKTAYRNAEPQSGDIIVAAKNDGFFVKRVVGVAGDRVQVIAGRLFINGAQIEREALGDFAFGDVHHTLYLEILPNGRRYRIVERSDHEFLDDTTEVTVPAGALFVMGDNRDNSMDSRVADFGLIPVGTVEGKAVFLTWARDWRRIGSKLE